ncbi:MAG TPA: ISKra4 family transposase [Verrucomicrobiae bacterium]
MIPDMVNLIPQGVLADWAQRTQASLAALLQTPNINLGHLEEHLEIQAKKLMLPILHAAAQVLAALTPFACRTCQEPLLVEAQGRTRNVGSVFGHFPFKRGYGRCPACLGYSHPADQTLGLQPQASSSPRVQEIAALMSIRSPYAQAAQDARRLMGLSPSPSFLHQETQRQGQRAIALRQQDIARTHTPQGVAELSARSETAELGPYTLVIEIDAWNIRERDDWGKTRQLRGKGQEPERWHWVYTATIFRLDQRGQTAGGRHVVTQRGYVATRTGLEAFTQQVYVEALLRGLVNAQQVLILADGAIWIWNLAGDRFKDAKQRVDLFHVKEHLHELARTLYGADSAAAKAWLQPLLRFLDRRKDGALDVLHHLEELRLAHASLTTVQQEALDKEIGYFTTHQQRMDYKLARAKGEPVGSGVVESTARQYQTRFKCTGQYWTLAGDEALLALATLKRNERWQLLFPHAKTAQAN